MARGGSRAPGVLRSLRGLASGVQSGLQKRQDISVQERQLAMRQALTALQQERGGREEERLGITRDEVERLRVEREDAAGREGRAAKIDVTRKIITGWIDSNRVPAFLLSKAIEAVTALNEYEISGGEDEEESVLAAGIEFLEEMEDQLLPDPSLTGGGGSQPKPYKLTDSFRDLEKMANLDKSDDNVSSTFSFQVRNAMVQRGLIQPNEDGSLNEEDAAEVRRFARELYVEAVFELQQDQLGQASYRETDLPGVTANSAALAMSFVVQRFEQKISQEVANAQGREFGPTTEELRAGQPGPVVGAIRGIAASVSGFGKGTIGAEAERLGVEIPSAPGPFQKGFGVTPEGEPPAPRAAESDDAAFADLLGLGSFTLPFIVEGVRYFHIRSEGNIHIFESEDGRMTRQFSNEDLARARGMIP